MRHVLHITVPPAAAPTTEKDDKIELESVVLTPETAPDVLVKIFTAESISLWQELA